MFKPFFKAIVLCAGVAASAFSVAATTFTEGKHYEVVADTATATPVVTEFFSFYCPHCYQFEATLNPWVEQLLEDVNFVRIPAMFGGPWDAHGQMFLTLEAMGVEHKVHNAVFNAIQKEHKKLTDKNDMADFLATQGVDKDKFLATFDSFAIKGQIVKARELAKKYEITGVPTMIVNGKYRFDLGTSGGPEQTLNVADQLIAKERAAK